VEVLEYGFMQRALLASLMVGLVAPAVGVFLVQRRLSLLGDGLGTSPSPASRSASSPPPPRSGRRWWPPCSARCSSSWCAPAAAPAGDVALAVLFYGGIAGGVVLLSLAPRGQATNLEAYLFGAITTTTTADVAVFGRHHRRRARVVWLLGPAAVRGQRRRGVRPRGRACRCWRSTSCCAPWSRRPSCSPCGSSACC
jgi:zinc transport system permease protein